jgi:hypothetical protein
MDHNTLASQVTEQLLLIPGDTFNTISERTLESTQLPSQSV